MASNVKFQVVAAVAVFTILLGVYTAKFWGRSETGTNFEMYYTAACLVRSNMSTHIYDVIGPNTNPQNLYADPTSVWARTAHAHGISRVTLYLYPPTLADLLTPLSVFSTSTALIVWYVLNLLMIVGLSAALTRILDIRFFGSTALVAAAVLLFRPVLNTFHWGQVTVLLLFLLTVGLSLYVNGHKSIAALFLVLAIAIKLEPIVIIIPFIAWRDWKFLRNSALWAIVLGLGLWAVNGSTALNLYFLHQLPAMWGGKLGTGGFDVNRSLGNIFYTYFGGTHAILSQRELAWLTRVVSVVILCSAGWLSRLKPGENSTNRQQFEIAMMFLLFTCSLSPYSWFYNWGLSAPAVVVLCMRAWEGRASTVETVLLVAFLLSLVTTKFDMAMVSPVLGIALGILVLHRMRLERSPAESDKSIPQLGAIRAA